LAGYGNNSGSFKQNTGHITHGNLSSLLIEVNVATLMQAHFSNNIANLFHHNLSNYKGKKILPYEISIIQKL